MEITFLGTRPNFYNEFYWETLRICNMCSILLFLVSLIKYQLFNHSDTEQENGNGTYYEKYKKRIQRWKSTSPNNHLNLCFYKALHVIVVAVNSVWLVLVYAWLFQLIFTTDFVTQKISCEIHHNCYEGPQGSLLADKYIFEIYNDHCPSQTSILDFFTITSPTAIADDCGENCCRVFTICESYINLDLSYSTMDGSLEDGYPNGYSSTGESQTHCSSLKDIIEFYLQNHQYISTSEIMIYSILVLILYLSVFFTILYFNTMSDYDPAFFVGCIRIYSSLCTYLCSGEYETTSGVEP